MRYGTGTGTIRFIPVPAKLPVFLEMINENKFNISQDVCANRTIATIATHDLAAIKGME
jgi:hypothetical protein